MPFKTISLPKDIINLAEDIKRLIKLNKDVSIKYCSGLHNRGASRIGKSVHMYQIVSSLYLWLFIIIISFLCSMI